MSRERRQVLDMLAEGKISADEAERLLERLAGSHHGESEAAGASQWTGDSQGGRAQGSAATGPASAGVPGRAAKPKYLRVVVDSADGDKVNVRVPLSLVRTGIALKTMLPQHAHEKLHERGIDLTQLSGLKDDELLDALRELEVDVDTTKGDTVRIFCE